MPSRTTPKDVEVAPRDVRFDLAGGAWYRPGFHPWDQGDRETLEGWKAEFNDLAVAG